MKKLELVDFEAGMGEEEAQEALRRFTLFPRILAALDGLIDCDLYANLVGGYGAQVDEAHAASVEAKVA